MSDNYEKLAARAGRGELTVKPETVQAGSPASRDDVTRMLMEATGAASAHEAARLAVGRPRAGTGVGPSPIVRPRVPEELKASVIALAKREHRKESDVVRDALAAYIAAHRAV